MNNKLLFLIKYTPFFSTVAMFIYTVLAYFNIRIEWISAVFGHPIIGCIVLFIASIKLKYCSIHRLLIIYPTIIHLCITNRNMLGDSIYLDLIRVVILFIGMSLILLTFIKKFNFCL